MNPEVVLKIDALDNTKAAFSSVKNNLGVLEKSTSSFRDKLESLQPTFQKMALVGTAAFAAVGAGVYKATQNAAAAEGSWNKFNTVFGEGADEMRAFINDIRKEMPTATHEIARMGADLQDLLVPMGLARDEAQGLTMGFLDVANKVAAFNDVDPTEVLEAFKSGLSGSSEPLRRFGINALDSSIELEALETGILQAGQKLTDLDPITRSQIKAQALLTLSVKQSSDAINGFEVNNDSLIRRQQDLQARTAELSVTLGNMFLPILDSVVKAILPVVTRLSEWTEANPELARNLVIAAGAIAGVVAVVGTLGLILPTVITGFALLLSPVSLIIAAFAGAALVIRNVNKNFQDFPLVLQLMFLPLKLVIEGFKQLYKVLQWVGDGIGWVFNKVRGTVAVTTAAAKHSVIDLQGTVNKFIDPLAGQSKLVDTFGGSIEDMGNDAEEAVDKIKALKEEAAGIFGTITEDEEGSNRQLAEAIVEQEQGISDKKKELRKLERAEDTDTNATRIRELRRTIQEEEAALRTAGQFRQQLRTEIDEAERRASLSAFERKVEDIQRERAARLEAQLTRLQEIQQEISAEQMKSNAIAGAFNGAQASMQSAIVKTREVAEAEAERMRRAFATVVGTMSNIGSPSIRNLTTPTVRRVNDAIISPKGDIISTHPDDYLIATKTPGALAGAGGGITINISGTFLDDRSAARRMGDELMRVLKQQQRI